MCMYLEAWELLIYNKILSSQGEVQLSTHMQRWICPQEEHYGKLTPILYYSSA